VLGKKHLVNEVYDELVFHEPSAMMHQCLTNTKHLSLAVYKHEIDCKWIQLRFLYVNSAN